MAIDRREFITKGLGTALLGTGLVSPALAVAKRTGQRVFDITTTVDLAKADAADQLWLPMFQNTAYQKLLHANWQSAAKIRLDRAGPSKAPMLNAHWASDAPSRQLTLTQRIAIWDRQSGPITHLSEIERHMWTASGGGITTDGIVRETARKIVGDLRDPKAQVRAIYDWVIANTWRDAAVPGCGRGDVAALLQTGAQFGKIGGKCADINSLMVALTRAIGIPARDIYGIRIAASQRYKSLGREGDITGGQHCRAEVWLESEGWFAVDPADVRKAVLEEKLAVDCPQMRTLGHDLFGNWETNWAAYNSDSAMALPGAPQAGQFHFLMYPTAMKPGAVSNSLDAKHFTYSITAQEILA